MDNLDIFAGVGNGLGLLYRPSHQTACRFEEHGLSIRPAREADLPNLIDFRMHIYDTLAPRLSSWYKKNPNAFYEEFSGYKGQDPLRRIYYTVEDGKSSCHHGMDALILGCGGLIQMSPIKQPDVAELTNLYLAERLRGKGLGRAILRDLVDKADMLGFSHIFLTTRKEFLPAINLYQSIGFKQIENTKYRSSSSLAFMLDL